MDVNTMITMIARREKAVLRLVPYVSLVMFAGLWGDLRLVSAETPLANFKAAAEMSGCESIPYPDLRRRCTDAGVDVWEGCKQVAWSCDGLKYQNSFDTTMNGIDEKIKALENEIYTLGRAQDQAKAEEKSKFDGQISAKKAEIETMKNRRKEQEEYKKGEKKEIELRVGQGKTCADKRALVQSYFDKTISEANRETDPEIVKIVNQTLMDRWKRSYEEHKKAEDDVARGKQKCEDKLR